MTYPEIDSKILVDNDAITIEIPVVAENVAVTPQEQILEVIIADAMLPQ